MRVGIYARYSSDRQSGASLTDQFRMCKALVQRRGWTVAGMYEDAAASGALRMRKGYQALLTDALSDKFDLVLAESLDRLNRDLEETARLYKRLKFVNVGIVTVSEGPISEVHVSISGLMGEMYLKSLGEKTRRGIEGRVLAGKSGGGCSYGYDVVAIDAKGKPITGERQVNEAEAHVVRDIFRRFAGGEGPRAIARALNESGVPGPSGRPWGDTTIRGHAKKGTGLLNNTMYVGKARWGRQRFVKDPSSGRRVARLNSPGTEIVVEVPQLRIVDQQLWEAVKLRQAEVSQPVSDPYSTASLNGSHRPRFLLSGLLICGVCGGGYTITAKDRYGCARRSRQGTCPNNRGIQRHELERRILDGLRSSLVTPDLVAEFVAEYQAEWNRLKGERRIAASERERRLADVKRKLSKIVEAIEQGIITATTKERLEALEAEKVQVERALVEVPLPVIHPNLAELYQRKVACLENELADPEIATEAKSVLRSLIKMIKVTPGTERGEVQLELHGDLAAILSAGIVEKKTDRSYESRNQVSVVAGIGFEPMTFRL